MKNGDKNKKSSKLLIVENQDKWDKMMNTLSKCLQEEEDATIKQIDRLNEELKLLKEAQ